LHVTFRDTQNLLGIGLMLGFYISPVFYSPASLPEKIETIFFLNPIALLLGAYRDILLYGKLPSFTPLGAIVGGSLVLLFLGYLTFTRASDRFAEEI
jgi:lipopolysaccharide transport system permease protein